MVRPKTGVPRGYQTVMPYLRVNDAVNAIKFYKKAFGAKETFRLRMPGPKIGHAELVIGGSVVMLSDAFPELGIAAPKATGGTSFLLTVYVENVDKLVAKAVKAGAKIRRPVADQFYGDRTGQIIDPFGHIWSIQSRIEKVAPKDMQKRLNAMLAGNASAAKSAGPATGRRKAVVKSRKAGPVRRAAKPKKPAKTVRK